MLESLLIEVMNAGVAKNSAVSAFDVPYGASPYTASVSVFGLPADADAAASTSAAIATPSSASFLMSSPLCWRFLGHRDATEGKAAGGLPDHVGVVTDSCRLSGL